MKKADMPPAPRRGHSCARQTLKQKLDRTPGMRLFHEEEQGRETVVHRTSSATRNFCGSLSGLRPAASKTSRSWLIRDLSAPADLNGLDTESNASSFGSMSGFGSRFGSAVDLAGLIGVEDLAVSGTPRETGSQVFLRSQLESDSRRNSLGGDFTPRHSRRNSIAGLTPRHSDGDERVFGERDDDFGFEQFALEGVVAPDEGTTQCNRNAADLKRVVLLQACARRVLARKHYQAMVKSASTIQHAWRGFSARQKHLQEMRIVAVVRIQSCYKGWMCRKWFKTMVIRVMLLQACSRRMLARRHYRAMVKAASTIHHAWRGFNAQRKLKLFAVTKIQSCYRGWIRRKLFKTMVVRVVLLQACARRMLVRRRYWAMVEAASTIQHAWRGFTAQRKLKLFAVTKIQSCYRGWICRKLFKTMVVRVVLLQACARRMLVRRHYWALIEAASTIQNAWRGFSARQKHLQEMRIVAVVRIQSCYKGWICRKLFKTMVVRVVLLQACARRMLVRRHYWAMVEAASTIQHAWRGFSAQQKLKIISVIKIQSFYNGWMCRTWFKTMVRRVVYIQACVRRTLATRYYKELRRVTIVLQRRRRKLKQLQLEDKERASLKIQSWWRSCKQQVLYLSLVQYRIDCALRIQHRWRRTRMFQLERLSRERAVVLIQAHVRGRRVRVWLKRRQNAVICIESAYWSYLQRRPKKLQCEQLSGSCLVDETHSPLIFLKDSILCGSSGSLDTLSPKSPLSVANSCVHPNSSEALNSDCGYISSQCSVSLLEDWSTVPIDELDQCLDTCLAALPLSAASSRQRSLASSRQCSSTFDVVSSSTFLDRLDAPASPGPVVAPASLKRSEVQPDWIGVSEVHGSAGRETIQPGSGRSSPLHTFYPSPSRELLVDEESVVEHGERSIPKSASKDEERLQHFAEIFLTMRQISLQQQRAQSAPPFPPPVAPYSSPAPSQSSPIIEAGPAAEVRNSRYTSVSLPPTPAPSAEQRTQKADVVLNMEDLLKTLEQYCEEDSGGCDMVTEGDIESGQNWRVRKTSTPTLGIKHLKLPDVNAVLIVLVAMVVYTRTVCREVFFRTRQSPRKN